VVTASNSVGNLDFPRIRLLLRAAREDRELDIGRHSEVVPTKVKQTFDQQVDDSLWTFLLSFAVYWYMSTVVAMAWHSKENAKHFGRSQSASECLNRQNLRLVGFSYGTEL
jgi:hypothetical protein